MEKLNAVWDSRHVYLRWFWIGAMVPTALVWKDSILWISLVSIYANVETSAGAYEASGNKWHLALAITWIILAIPTVLFWSESVLWLAMMSVYANIMASVTAEKAKDA